MVSSSAVEEGSVSDSSSPWWNGGGGGGGGDPSRGEEQAVEYGDDRGETAREDRRCSSWEQSSRNSRHAAERSGQQDDKGGTGGEVALPLDVARGLVEEDDEGPVHGDTRARGRAVVKEDCDDETRGIGGGVGEEVNGAGGQGTSHRGGGGGGGGSDKNVEWWGAAGESSR